MQSCQRVRNLKNADMERPSKVLQSCYLRQHKINSAPASPQSHVHTEKQTTVEPLLNLSAQTEQSVTTNSSQSAFFCWLQDKSKQLDKDIPSQLLHIAEAENCQQMRKIIRRNTKSKYGVPSRTQTPSFLFLTLIFLILYLLIIIVLLYFILVKNILFKCKFCTVCQLKLSHITSDLHIAAVLVTSDFTSNNSHYCMSTSMTCPRRPTVFQVPRSNDALFIVIKSEAKQNIRMTAVLLLTFCKTRSSSRVKYVSKFYRHHTPFWDLVSPHLQVRPSALLHYCQMLKSQESRCPWMTKCSYRVS